VCKPPAEVVQCDSTAEGLLDAQMLDLLLLEFVGYLKSFEDHFVGQIAA